jgi:hypothetical protein
MGGADRDACFMRVVPDDEYPEFIRRLREQARRDAEELVPRPGFPIYGLAAPSLTPAFVSETTKANGEWTLITLTYGRPEDVPAGPYVTVTTLPLPPEADRPVIEFGMPTGRHGIGPEGELRFAVEREQDRAARWAEDSGADESSAGDSSAGDSSAEPVVVGRETLPAGEALIVRQGIVWAARPLAGQARVAVTVVGRGVSPESVRLEQVPSLRPLIEARSSELTRRIKWARARLRPPLAVADPPPAEGVAALRALADFTLATGAEIRLPIAAGRDPRYGFERAGRHRALWQRAVTERQRLAAEGKRAADDVVTSAVNHLGNLASEARWFTADQRLREAAIDQTLRYAMLGDRVPSERAQYLWARHWAARMSGFGSDPGPDEVLARVAARERFKGDWIAAWEAWAANA